MGKFLRMIFDDILGRNGPAVAFGTGMVVAGGIGAVLVAVLLLVLAYD